PAADLHRRPLHRLPGIPDCDGATAVEAGPERHRTVVHSRFLARNRQSQSLFRDYICVCERDAVGTVTRSRCRPQGDRTLDHDRHHSPLLACRGGVVPGVPNPSLEATERIRHFRRDPDRDGAVAVVALKDPEPIWTRPGTHGATKRSLGLWLRLSSGCIVA